MALAKQAEYGDYLELFGAADTICFMRRDGCSDQEIADFFDGVNFYPDPESWDKASLIVSPN